MPRRRLAVAALVFAALSVVSVVLGRSRAGALPPPVTTTSTTTPPTTTIPETTLPVTVTTSEATSTTQSQSTTQPPQTTQPHFDTQPSQAPQTTQSSQTTQPPQTSLVPTTSLVAGTTGSASRGTPSGTRTSTVPPAVRAGNTRIQLSSSGTTTVGAALVLQARARLRPKQRVPIYLDQRNGSRLVQLAESVLADAGRRPVVASTELRVRWSRPGVRRLSVYAGLAGRRRLVRDLTIKVRARR